MPPTHQQLLLHRKPFRHQTILFTHQPLLQHIVLAIDLLQLLIVGVKLALTLLQYAIARILLVQHHAQVVHFARRLLHLLLPLRNDLALLLHLLVGVSQFAAQLLFQQDQLLEVVLVLRLRAFASELEVFGQSIALEFVHVLGVVGVLVVAELVESGKRRNLYIQWLYYNLMKKMRCAYPFRSDLAAIRSSSSLSVYSCRLRIFCSCCSSLSKSAMRSDVSVSSRSLVICEAFCSSFRSAPISESLRRGGVTIIPIGLVTIIWIFNIVYFIYCKSLLKLHF